MGLKTRNLEKLLNDNINIFEYKEIRNINQLIDYSAINNKFTIRFDRDYDIEGLPFYKYDDNLDLFKIYEEASNMNCTLLLSNGYKYDNDLVFNFVIDINSNNDFILEICNKKVPLRDMYKYNTCILKGNLFDKNYKCINLDYNIYNIDDIEKIIDLVINLEVRYHYIEGSMYSRNVGLLSKKIVVWQTK